ncbi:MAG: S41 family peptidase [Candidatus Portnoybacteria bacterium]|nr:S41 family peptidase [Candidatus Portnoybacteria bacterium]
MNKKTRKYILIPVWIILLFTVFGFGFFIGQNKQPSIDKIEGLANKEASQTINADFGLFWDAWNVIEKKYVNRFELDRQKMVYGAIIGMIDSLGDPYSIFMEPQESKKFIDDISGSFEGIGAEIGIRKGTLTIISPLEGNPAQKAGLKPGDKVLKINDTLTSDLTLDEAVNLIRGKKGTEVSLLIFRDEWDEAKEIKVIRDTIQIPIIKWEVKDGNIAYIQLYHFTENMDNQFEKIVKEIIKLNPNGIVLDLRNNPGGYLEVAVNIASWFLPKGELVVIEDFGNGENNNEFISRGYKELENIPVVVLINEGSASASEILAGALRDIQGIKLVGQKSFGKGSVQQLEKLKGDSSIKITVAKWLTPLGTSISEEGIIPDEEVEITLEDINEMRDPQLDKALELLRQ